VVLFASLAADRGAFVQSHGPARYAEGSAEPAVDGSALNGRLAGLESTGDHRRGANALGGAAHHRALRRMLPVDKQIEAAGGYEAQQMRCVDHYANRVDIDRCRDRVKAAWATDAGNGRLA